MKVKLLLPLLLATILLASCSQVYTPALYHQDIAYQPKPTSFDSVKHATYASAAFNIYSNTNLSDELVSGQINLSQGYTFKGFNVAYGAFGVFGDYEKQTNSDNNSKAYFNDKFFGAVGGRASANLFVTSGRTDIRFLGVEAAYSHEFGSYADFRKSVQNENNITVDPRTDLLTIGLTSEIIFHPMGNDNIQHGIRGFLGTTLGRYDYDGSNLFSGSDDNNNNSNGTFLHRIFPKASYFIKFKDYFGTVEVGSQVFIRFGVAF